MEEIKIGEYTRINGKIGIIKDIILNGNLYEDSGIYLENEKIIMGKEEIHKLKSNKNIIELLEVGDYVNGLPVMRICIDNETKEKYLNMYGSISEWGNEDIKSVVTKEQFNSVKYDVEG